MCTPSGVTGPVWGVDYVANGLYNWTSIPMMLSTPSSYQEPGNKTDICGNMIYPNITADSPGEYKKQSIPSKLVRDNDLEIMGTAYCPPQSMSRDDSSPWGDQDKTSRSNYKEVKLKPHKSIEGRKEMFTKAK